MAVEIQVREGESLDKALKRFKNAVGRENILQEYRRKEFYEKPSTIKNRKNREIKRRIRKKKIKDQNERKRNIEKGI